MKASFRQSYGRVESLKIKELKKPNLKADQILVRVHATTINRTDIALVTGKPFIMRFVAGFPKPRLAIPGTDFAGVIEEVGPAVKNYKVGDRIFGFNDNGLGSQAEYISISKNEAIDIIPDNISFNDAAASLEGAHYAWNFLNKVNLKIEHKVMVNGATGAIGSALLQFVKSIGCSVNAVADSENQSKIKSLGANKVFNYEAEDFTKIDNEKYDFIFDAVGKSSFKKCKPLLTENGIYISSELGEKNENPFLALRSKFFGKKKVIFPIPSNIHESINKSKNLMVKNKFKPLIDRIYGLEEIVNAYQYVSSGKKNGNVILDLSPKKIK